MLSHHMTVALVEERMSERVADAARSRQVRSARKGRRARAPRVVGSPWALRHLLDHLLASALGAVRQPRCGDLAGTGAGASGSGQPTT